MNLSDNVVLITGGSSGIGLAFAERFVKAGSEVLICGRREDKLRAAKHKLLQVRNSPDNRSTAVHTRVCDVSHENERVALFEWATAESLNVNVLVNNAGIQRRTDLSKPEAWERTRPELAINLEAPLHLSRLFIPYLLQHKREPQPVIINVTSGLAFAPLANVPIYCATKAALHSFTLSLRQQLSGTAINVIEIIPPAVNTDLGGLGLHTFGVSLNEFADGVFERLATNDDREIAYGFAEKASRASREELTEIFKRLNSDTPVTKSAAG